MGHRPWLAWAVAAMAAVAMLCGACAGHRMRGAGPVLDLDFPDPFVLAVDDGLVAYATNTRRDGHPIHVQVSRSRDGVSWRMPVDAMPTLPAWVDRDAPSIWAPEVLRIGDRYVLYFSARHATRKRPDGLTLCIAVATSASPDGPFVGQPQPLTCGGEHGVIDASPFRDGERLWLLYKRDGNCCDAPTPLVAQRLSADGLSLLGTPAELRGIGLDRPWKGHVVEAPQMVRANGRDWLFYSANDYGNGAYATGYAACDGPAGPCRDASENPILRTANGPAIGPGHPGVFRHHGQTWIAYHGWRSPKNGGRRYRAMYIDRLEWVDGRAVVRPRDDAR